MKILFLCGSLEPGKDGVGDYIRRLAGELIRQGHEAAIVSLNDRHTQAEERIVQSSEGTNILVLRIPSMFSAKKRFSLASGFINSFDPEWLSLQFVPYSFNVKGLPFGLAGKLKKIGKGRKWHIMFHELWLQRYTGVSLKIKILSYIQEFIVCRMLVKLNPKLIHTHLPFYQTLIKKRGYDTLALPLFSNIRVFEKSQQATTRNVFRLGFFSQMEILPSITDLINRLSFVLKKRNLKLEIYLIGGSNAYSISSSIRKLCPDVDNIICTGFLEDKDISEYINFCNFGITSVPRHALGKSGSVAAFLSHNVPVFAPVYFDDYKYLGIGFFDQELRESIVIDEDVCDPDFILEMKFHLKNKISLEDISCKFIYDITQLL